MIRLRLKTVNFDISNMRLSHSRWAGGWNDKDKHETLWYSCWYSHLYMHCTGRGNDVTKMSTVSRVA